MLRNLLPKDSVYMYEWMQDPSITKNLQNAFEKYTMDDVKQFIDAYAEQDNANQDLHYAIVNDQDEYLGTISLKNINRVSKNAEYAIVVRKSAQGTGVAMEATKDILKVAFAQLNLNKVYLYVSTENVAANKFYKKAGFEQEGIFRKHLYIKDGLKDIVWFAILREDFCGCV